MPKYKKNYITADHFELLQKIGVDYEGFVEGVGYVYNIYLAFTPPHMDISVPLRYAPPGMDQFIIGWMQCIDSSEEIIKMSYGDKETVAVEVGEGAQSQGTASVYIENDGVGHAYLEVNGTVFSYGRYNGSYSPSSGAFGPVGEGVLYKKTGDAATKFIADRTAQYPTKQYSFNVNTTATYNYFNNAYNAGTYNTVDSRVIDTYFLLGNNCTTGVCGGLQAGGSGMPIIQTPAGFVNFMYNVKRMQNGWNPGAVVPWEPKY